MAATMSAAAPAAALQVPPFPRARRDGTRRASVLVVEDDEALRESLACSLHRAGYDVSAGADGSSGLDRVVLTAPDAVLLDLRMPRMHGYEFLRHLRASPWSSVPVVVLTGDAEGAAALERGDVDGLAEHVRCYVKPCPVAVVIAAIDAALGRPRPRDQDFP